MSLSRRQLQKDEQATELTQEEMDLVVSKLNQISREVTLDYAIRVGSLIVHYVYGGDTTAWHDKRTKPLSFRRLSERPDLPMSPTALYRCVATFVLCERLDVVNRWKNLTATHLRTVLNLAASEQTRLLAAANAQRWSAQRLENEARAARAALPRGGRPPSAPLLKLARSLARCLGENGDIVCNLSARSALSDDERRQVEQMLEQARGTLERAWEALQNSGAKVTHPVQPAALHASPAEVRSVAGG